jgi:hypothetical protein
MTLEHGAAEAEVKIRTPRHALVWRLALGVCWLAWAGAMQRAHRVLFALIWLFVSGATVATAIWYRTFGIDLTRDAAIVRSFRRRSIPWREVQAVVRYKPGGPSGGAVELNIEGGKPVLLPAPTSIFGLGAAQFERDCHRIDQWWLAHRGESWRHVRADSPRPPAQR